MIQRAFRYASGVVFLIALMTPAPGQDTGQFYKKPETADEYWRYMNHEIELGQYKVAAGFLKGFLAKNPSDDDLLKLQENEGSAVFLRLLNFPEMRADAKPLVERVDAIVQKHLGDRKRLDALINNLTAEPEERDYALVQLQRSGVAAVPALVDALIRTVHNVEEHTAILSALKSLDKGSVPPIVAALDANNEIVRIELINLLRQRAAYETTPFLWYYSASPRQPEGVRKAAAAALSSFLGLSPDRLPLARIALTEQAERYYQHQVPLATVTDITVWRWNGKQLAADKMSPTQAEEYYGLRFARQALELAPDYQPAQVVFLSLALDKGMERSGLDQPLSKGELQVKELLTSVHPDLVIKVLDKALKEHRLTVILGAVRALGELSEVRAARPGERGVPALVRALNYPDRRVQMAAVDALLRVGGTPPPLASSRVVNVLRRLVVADAAPKVLVADSDKDRAALVGQAAKASGFEPIVVHTGKEALRRLAEAADFDAVLVDAKIQDPQLPNLLAQLRADQDVGLLPVVVTTEASEVERLQRQWQRYRNVFVIATSANRENLKPQLTASINEASGKPLTDTERKDFAARALEWLTRLARGEAPGYDIRPAESAILHALRSKELAGQAVEAAGHLPGREPQLALAAVVLNAALPEALRSAASIELCRHIQNHGLLLSTDQVKGLIGLYDSMNDSKLKANVSLVLGSLKPDARQTGERLQRYEPSFVSPAKPAAPPAPKEDKEGKSSDDKN